MPRRVAARAEALRLALQAKSARDTARQHREALIESALADYYQAAAEAERVRDAARRKAAALLADAEHTAGPQAGVAANAVRRLRDLLGGITETAQLCGLTVPAARDLLAGRALAGDGSDPRAPHPAQDSAAPASHLPAGEGDHRDQ